MSKLAAVSLPRLPLGRHSDGGGLYLVVDKHGRRWVFMFHWGGKRVEMGLGSLRSVSLAVARDKANAARSQLGQGVNPLLARKVLGQTPTFGAVADSVLSTKTHGFRRERSAAIWKRALEVYAAPLRGLRVDAIDITTMLAVLQPIWETKPETASKVRGCIEAVLAAAKVRGWRSGENPAAWRGNLDHLLPRLPPVGIHLAAMPYAAVPAFVKRLREDGSQSARALEFLILTAARTNEVLGATVDEVDLDAGLWTVPGTRMKSGRLHRVPLSAGALELCTAQNGYLFASPLKRSAPLSSNTIRACVIRMDVPYTAHGFRSSFRDWAGDKSAFPRELAEAALSHLVGDATERAYARSDALEKRRKLMDAWGEFIENH